MVLLYKAKLSSNDFYDFFSLIFLSALTLKSLKNRDHPFLGIYSQLMVAGGGRAIFFNGIAMDKCLCSCK